MCRIWQTEEKAYSIFYANARNSQTVAIYMNLYEAHKKGKARSGRLHRSK